MSKAALWIVMTAFALAGPMLAVAPLGIAPLLIGAALIGYIVERVQSGTWPRVPTQPIVLFAVFLGWCALSLTWDLNRASGATKLPDIALILLSLLAMFGLAGRVKVEQRQRFCVALVAGMAAGLVLLAIETLFGFPLYRAVMGSSPKLADLVESKRSVDALPLLIWPVCLALVKLGRPWAGALLAVLFTAASVKLTASSATMGMAFALVIFGLSFLSVTWTRRLLGSITILAFLLIIPVALLAYDEGGTTAKWLKHSGQHRVEIWHFAAEKSLEQPILGYGFNASRYVPNGDAISRFLPPGQSLIPLHPHDAFLQVWLEIGLVGVVIVAALLLALLRGVARWPAGIARFTLPGYAAGMIVAGLAFGIWQSWWMATIAFSIVAYRMIGPELDHG